MSLRKEVITGVSWLAIAQGAQRVAGLVVAAILARLLPASDFGLISMALITVNLIGLCRDIGITTSLVQRTTVSARDLNTAFWMNTTLGCGLYIVGFISAPMFSSIMSEPRVLRIIPVILLSVPIFTLAQVPDALLQRRMSFRVVAITEILATLLSGTVGVVMAFSGYGVWSLVAQNVSFALLLTLGRFGTARWIPRVEFDRQSARELLRFSSKVFGASVAAYGVRNIDNAIVGAKLGAGALGYYALAYNIMLLPAYVITGVVTRVLYPALASIKDDLARLRTGYLRAVRLASSLTIPIAVGMGVTAPLLIPIVYGQRWMPAAPILQILTVVGLLEGMNFWGIVFYAVGRPQVLVAWFTMCVVIMAATFLVGAHYGIAGVARGYALVAPFTLGIPHLLIGRIIGLSFPAVLRALYPALVSAAGMGVVLELLELSGALRSSPPIIHLATLVISGAALYALLMYVIAVHSHPQKNVRHWLLMQE